MAMSTSSTHVRTAQPGSQIRVVPLAPGLGAAMLLFLPVLASAQPPMPLSDPGPVAQTQAVGVIPSVRFAEPDVAAHRF